MNQPNQPPPNPDSPYPQQAPPGQYQQQMPPGQYSPYPPKKPGMNTGLKVGLIVGGVVLGMFVLFGVLVGVLAVAVAPRIAEATQELDAKNASELGAGLQETTADMSGRRELSQLGDVAGWELWAELAREGVINPGLHEKMASHGNDADTAASGPENVTSRNCSYTAPRANEVSKVLSLGDSDRCVLLCFNSRNWDNHPDRGVLVYWSDGSTAQYLTFEEANRDWGITRIEWDNPAAKLFGMKAPFQHVYE